MDVGGNTLGVCFIIRFMKKNLSFVFEKGCFSVIFPKAEVSLVF